MVGSPNPGKAWVHSKVGVMPFSLFPLSLFSFFFFFSFSFFFFLFPFSFFFGVRERLFGALRFARSFKKMPPTYGDFGFFPENTPDFETWSWIFFQQKKFLKFFAEIQWFMSLQTNYDRSCKNFTKHLFSENSPDFGTWSWIFFYLTFFPHFFSK